MGLLGELRAIPEYLSLAASAPITAYLSPVGAPRPVLVIPGLISGDSATLPLRAFLRSFGHRPHGWGQGLNVGPAHHMAEGLDNTLTELAERYGGPIDIVGWSAGGIFGRVLASHRSELVRQVISLGSPVRLRTEDSNMAAVSDFLGRFYLKGPSTIDVDSVPVPSTTVWTASDGVVPPDACRQTVGEFAESVQVRGSHSGLPANPAVYYLVADRLALPVGEWSPFNPPAKLRRLYPTIES
ncbi:MAG: pimeloyl-ACP methyl ester carboxylesterase [Acidimicrobiales bacterium]